MYQIKINELIVGDCLDLFKDIPDESVDMVFADPPFNLKKKYGSYSDDLKIDEYVEWSNEWLFEMARVTKKTGSIFVHNIPKWAIYHASQLNNLADFSNWICWKTMSGPPNTRTLHPTHYSILFYAKDIKQQKRYALRMPHERCRKCSYLYKDYGGKKKILHPFGPLLGDVWTDIYRVRHKKKRDKHPCQLPVHLLERLILMSTDEGDVVLDPFIGTGTTAISAKKLGRNYIGFDLDKDYVKIANNKLNKVKSDSKLGSGYWVSFYLGKVVTIRDKDWENLSNCYKVPKIIESIDNIEIMLGDNTF